MFESDFTVGVFTSEMSSDGHQVVINIDEVEVDIDIPELTQEQITNGHIEQLKAMKEKLKADTHVKLQSLDEQIESLLAIECK